jgi:hypothetical protein
LNHRRADLNFRGISAHVEDNAHLVHVSFARVYLWPMLGSEDKEVPVDASGDLVHLEVIPSAGPGISGTEEKKLEGPASVLVEGAGQGDA